MKEIILQKQNEVNATVEKMKNSSAFIAFKYQGLTVEKFMQLRRNLREMGCTCEVIKNNITSRAVKECGYDLEDAFVGPVAIVFSAEDVVAPAKALFDFAKDNEKVQVVKGVVDGDVYSFDQLQTLSALPSYETLLTQLAAGMLGTVRNLAVGLNLYAEKLEENA